MMILIGPRFGSPGHRSVRSQYVRSSRWLNLSWSTVIRRSAGRALHWASIMDAPTWLGGTAKCRKTRREGGSFACSRSTGLWSPIMSRRQIVFHGRELLKARVFFLTESKLELKYSIVNSRHECPHHHRQRFLPVP
jgi:hypothetical protein